MLYRAYHYSAEVEGGTHETSMDASRQKYYPKDVDTPGCSSDQGARQRQNKGGLHHKAHHDPTEENNQIASLIPNHEL